MAEWIASYSKKFFILKGMMDQYYGLAIIPVLVEKGLKQIEAIHVTRDLTSRIYQNLMSKMLDAGLRIPESDLHGADGKLRDHPLITELLTLQATIHSKYMITVKAPDVKGMHDDMCDAFARSVFLATEFLSTGGGVTRQNVTQATGDSMTYKKYLRKSKQNAIYTNRPSPAVLADLTRRMPLNYVGVPQFRGR
jgi:hypothetical protein